MPTNVFKVVQLNFEVKFDPWSQRLASEAVAVR